MEAVFIAIVVGLFGAGGIATLYKARNDYQLKKSASELSADTNLMNRLEKQILELNAEARSDEKYINLLANTLIKNGIQVPDRKD